MHEGELGDVCLNLSSACIVVIFVFDGGLPVEPCRKECIHPKESISQYFKVDSNIFISLPSNLEKCSQSNSLNGGTTIVSILKY